MKIHFCGAANGVTGSCHLITSGEHKILLDCGQFQGGKTEKEENYGAFPFEPSEIECVVLSHAHIDHCGRLPLLVQRGFDGPIYCTDATADLLVVMLKDAAHIQEKEAEWQNKKNERAGRPLIEPLYTMKDAENALTKVKPILYDQLFAINPEMNVVFNDAGHILGSAITELWVTEGPNDNKDYLCTSKLVYSGDIGVMNRPILRNPTIIKKADYLIMETTYGNRLHPPNALSVDQLIDIAIETTQRGGTVVIPSFAVGRTQELIYELNKFFASDNPLKKKLENIKIYVDSPMASAATEVFKKNAQVFDEETKDFLIKGDNPLEFPNLKFVETTEESQSLNMNHEPKIIISASGMCEAGRIRHHLKHNLWNPKASVVFVGYQGQGTLGRAILDGIPEVTLFGETIKVNAQIHNLEGFSGHADRDGLLGWLGGFKEKPKQIFLVHGEEEAKRGFVEFVKEKLGYETTPIFEMSEFEVESARLLSKDERTLEGIKGQSEKEIKEEFDAFKQNMLGVWDKIGRETDHFSDETNLTPEKLAELKNAALELEKTTYKIASLLSK